MVADRGQLRRTSVLHGQGLVYVRGLQSDGRQRFAERMVTNPLHTGAVDLRTVGDQTQPTVAVDRSGAFVVAWTERQRSFFDPDTGRFTSPPDRYDNSDVWARGFNPAGTVAGRFAERRMNAQVAWGQQDTALAVDPGSGELTLAYTDASVGNHPRVHLRTGFPNR